MKMDASGFCSGLEFRRVLLRCSGAGVYSQTFTAISANGDYTTSPGFTTLVAGTYHWTASFTGDGNNKSASSRSADHTSELQSRSATVSPILLQTSGTVGHPSNDKATLPGGVHLDGIFFFNDTATTEIYTLSLHDALPI